MTDPLSTQAARLLEIQQRLDRIPARDRDDGTRDAAWLLAELTAAEAERDRWQQQLSIVEAERGAFERAWRDAQSQLTAAREALRQVILEMRPAAEYVDKPWYPIKPLGKADLLAWVERLEAALSAAAIPAAETQG
jgi:chromosome segregation ATPase